MLNGTGQLQNVVLFGGNSDIGLAILKKLPMARDSTLILVGRNLNYNQVASQFPESNVEIIEFDFENIDKIDRRRDIYIGSGCQIMTSEFANMIINNIVK
jgi:short-subunit dehydrogenase